MTLGSIFDGSGGFPLGAILCGITPVECARLQGFPDWWCKNIENENPSKEDMEFWRCVFKYGGGR